MPPAKETLMPIKPANDSLHCPVTWLMGYFLASQRRQGTPPGQHCPITLTFRWFMTPRSYLPLTDPPSNSYQATSTTKTLLLTNLFALCLKVDNFATKVETLSHDLSMSKDQ